MKFGAIDIGSNAVRLLIAKVHELDDGRRAVDKLSFYRVPVRLGADVFSDGAISEGKIKHLVKTMKAFWYLMDVHGVEWFHAYATSAMRESSNVKDVVKKVKKAANIDIEPISGDREAELIFGNFAQAVMDTDNDYLYIDVGGGSTELTLIREGERVKSKSFSSEPSAPWQAESPTENGVRWRPTWKTCNPSVARCTPSARAGTPTVCNVLLLPRETRPFRWGNCRRFTTGWLRCRCATVERNTTSGPTVRTSLCPPRKSTCGS